jgi:ABC-2 type transport system ATP-binding protein
VSAPGAGDRIAGAAGTVDEANVAISALGLTRRFGDFTAVDDVSLRVERGTIFAFLGANGSGKTTTIKMLIGLLAPTAGSITVAGVDVIRSPRRVREAIGYMGQKVSLYRGLSLYENVEFYGGLHGIGGRALQARWGAMRERFSLGDVEKSHAEDLPAGIRQRAGLAVAMLHEPEVLFLDEPTAGVDVGSRTLFWELIAEQKKAGVTVFVTTHFLDEVDYCDHVSFIDAGRLVAESTPEGLRERWSQGYSAFVPLAGERIEAGAKSLAAAGWKTERVDGGLRLRAAQATEPMLAAITKAVAPADLPRVRVDQPGMSGVFERLIDEGRARAADPSADEVEYPQAHDSADEARDPADEARASPDEAQT